MNKKADRMLEAGKLYLKIGNYEQYCESLISIGNWERALAFAPAVSMEYWQSLTKKYAEYQASEQPESAYEGQILSGQAEQVYLS